MRRRYLAPIALALLVLLAGCAGQTTPLATPDGTDTDRRTITVSASGEASMAPDIATVHVTVEATADDAETARSTLADDASSVRQALLDAGVAEDDIQTTRYAIYPEYDREREDVTGYRATHAYEITVRNPENAGSVIDTAVGAGADRVTGVQFGLSEATRQDVRTQAIEAAMANAKQDATAVATAGDVTLGPVHTASVSTQSAVFRGVEYASAGDAGGATKIDSGPVEVRVQVTVTYQIS
jgi:hypothetical protein